MSSAVWYLYRLWSADGRVMYVGITSQDPPERRIVQHAQRAWWPYVDSTRTELEVLNRGQPITKSEAETIERRAIQTGGGTLANNEWNGGRGAMFERFLQTGGRLTDWDPHTVTVPTTTMPDPWSHRAGELVVTVTVTAGLVGAVIAFATQFL